ncbi:restriction endonuclease subunit S, partial [uncultured Desulfovibrio sp.]|uniref:restriction endonuclease subunit S n=1 Tax=uncultured Desulfovibrio sp. TaxID=167968 RepID=UPI002614E741
WEVRRLKHTLSLPLQYGANASGIDYNEKLPRYIRITDIDENGCLKSDNKQSLSERDSLGYILEDGDILLARSGATVGKSFLYKKEFGRAAFAGYLIRAKFNISILNYLFFYYITQSKAYAEWKDSNFIQATIQNIGAEKYNNLYIPVPPLPEQQHIADYLDAKCARIDATVELVRQSMEKLRAYKLSLITEAVTKGLDPDVPMKDSGIPWIGEIPEEWNVYHLSSVIVDIQNGYVGPTRGLFIDSGVPYIQSLHIKNGEIVFTKNKYFVSRQWADVHPKIYKNDILFVQTGDIGQVAIVGDAYDGCSCHALIIARPNCSIVCPTFLLNFFIGYAGQRQIHIQKTGALLPHLNSTKLKSALVLLPPLAEQQRIADYLDDKCARIDAVLEEKERLLERLAEYKKSLIFECVTGKREVSA